jgi:hypothetical protein
VTAPSSGPAARSIGCSPTPATPRTPASRADLAERIDRADARHADHTVTALVAGEFKQGKSTLVNALLNVGICGVADDVSTVVPTTLRHGAEASAVVHYAVPGDSAATTAEAIELERVAELGTEQGNPGNRHGIRAIEVTLPRRLLSGGLTVVDSPGVGGLDASHAASTERRDATRRARAVRQRCVAAADRQRGRFLSDAAALCPRSSSSRPRPTSSRHGVGSSARTSASCASTGSTSGRRGVVGAAPAGDGRELDRAQRRVGLPGADRAAAQRQRRARRHTGRCAPRSATWRSSPTSSSRPSNPSSPRSTTLRAPTP